MNVVVFCGAGFSASLGLPTMTSFASAVERSRTLAEGDKIAFGEIMQYCAGSALAASVNVRNLEDLMSLLEVLSIIAPSVSLSQTIELPPSVAITVIRDAIVHVCHPESTTHGTNCAGLVGALASRYDTTFITTNYDLNIELGAASSGHPIESPILRHAKLASQQANVSFGLYRPPAHSLSTGQARPVYLYKLHGSVNWAESNGKIAISDQIGFGLGNAGDRTAHVLNFKAQNKTILVAPSFFKKFDASVYAEQWQGAAMSLAEAHVVLVIGYSFPSSDRMMRYFFASSLERNTTLQRFVFVDPNVGQIYAANREFFDGPILRHVFQPFPCDWKLVAGTNLVKVVEGSYVPDANDSLTKKIQALVDGRHAFDRALGKL